MTVSAEQTFIDWTDPFPPVVRNSPGERPQRRATEAFSFLAVGGVVALIGYAILVQLTRMNVSATVAEAVQAVITLQLSFLGNDRVTYRNRPSMGLGLRARWARYQSGRIGVTVLSVALFAAVAPLMGHHIGYWFVLAVTAIGNFLVDRTWSHRVARRDASARSRPRSVAVMLAALLALVLVSLAFPIQLITAVSIFMVVLSVTTLSFQLYAWRTPEAISADAQIVPDADSLRVVVFLAARKEESVLGATLERMVSLNHRNYMVWVIVDHRDDFETLAIARDYAARYPHIVRVVAYPDNPISSKPIGLNEAMRVLQASGEPWDVIGIADAEDRFHVDLLSTVDHLVRHRNPGVVQGAVQLVNYGVRASGHHVPDGYLVALVRGLLRLGVRLRGGDPSTVTVPQAVLRLDRTGRFRRGVQHLTSGWWRAANCLEYFKWFSSRLKMQASVKVMPLGGNTVFFTRPFIESLHERTGSYWDEECLTEDCKIGILASVMGYSVEVFSLPQMATLEETPATLPRFVRQRVRWMQGFIQVFFEGAWRELPTFRQRLIAVYVLGFQFFQAFAGAFAPFGLAFALYFKAPAPVVLLSLVPLLIAIWTTVFDLLMLHDFGDAYDPVVSRRARHSQDRGNRVGVLDYLGVALGGYLFQVVLALSAIGAIYRSLAGITNWVKTDHSGAHLGEDVTTRIAR